MHRIGPRCERVAITGEPVSSITTTHVVTNKLGKLMTGAIITYVSEKPSYIEIEYYEFGRIIDRFTIGTKIGEYRCKIIFIGNVSELNGANVIIRAGDGVGVISYESF